MAKHTNIKGTKGDDLLFGTPGADEIHSFTGNDTILAGAGNDKINTEDGDKIIFGGAGRDDIHTHQGNDYIDAGAGSDHVHSDKGNDTLVYRLADNPGRMDHDKYDAGGGIDTLWLQLTQSEWLDSLPVQRDANDYRDFLDGVKLNKHGEAGGKQFEFATFDLDARHLEKLVVDVDGVILSSTAQIVGTATGFVREDTGSQTITANKVVALDLDFDESRFQDVDPLALAGTYGDFTFDAATGAWAYKIDNSDPLVQALGRTTFVHDFLAVSSLDGSDSITIDVTIRGRNDAPIITSDGGGASAALSVAENTTAVTTVTASDVDVGDSKTFSISGGADAGSFTIDATSGVLAFMAAPDFEARADADGDNNYEVQVQVDDGSATDVQDITVAVTDTNEAPVITSNGGGPGAAMRVDENTTAVTTVMASDQDAGDTLVFSLTNGADQAKFEIDSNTGALSFIDAPDFEAPADADLDNRYEVQVTVTDSGGLTDVQNIRVRVMDANEAPGITSDGGGDSAIVRVEENTTAVTTVMASDPDPGDTRAFSITGGVDGVWFTIDPDTGVLAFNDAPDFEAPNDDRGNNTYKVEVTVTDGGALTDSQEITVRVTDVAVLHEGTPAGDPLSGGGPEDVFLAGAGDDVIELTDASFALVDGGAGTDVLLFSAPFGELDLTLMPNDRVTGIEKIDLGGAGPDHTMRLDPLDVLAMNGGNEIFVLGNIGSALLIYDIDINLSGPTPDVRNGVMYNHYTAGAANLLVDQDVAVIVI